jgi:hypothetical protein
MVAHLEESCVLLFSRDLILTELLSLHTHSRQRFRT